SMRNLPFHTAAAGSLTSDLISESADGQRVSEPRQWVAVCSAAVTSGRRAMSAQGVWANSGTARKGSRRMLTDYSVPASTVGRYFGEHGAAFLEAPDCKCAIGIVGKCVMPANGSHGVFDLINKAPCCLSATVRCAIDT